MRVVVWLVAMAALLSLPAAGAEPIGIITELHLKNGQVEVKPAAGGDWQAVKPLFAISAGDQVRATGAGRIHPGWVGSGSRRPPRAHRPRRRALAVGEDDRRAGPLAVAPADVRLAPGRYRWELESPEHGIQGAAFDVATAEAATGVRAAVAAVELARYPAATGALLKAAGLMRERFFADARRELLRGVAANPEEPTLHLLLG